MFSKGGHTNIILSPNSFLITLFSFQYTDQSSHAAREKEIYKVKIKTNHLPVV